MDAEDVYVISSDDGEDPDKGFRILPPPFTALSAPVIQNGSNDYYGHYDYQPVTSATAYYQQPTRPFVLPPPFSHYPTEHLNHYGIPIHQPQSASTDTPSYSHTHRPLDPQPDGLATIAAVAALTSLMGGGSQYPERYQMSSKHRIASTVDARPAKKQASDYRDSPSAVIPFAYGSLDDLDVRHINYRAQSDLQGLSPIMATPKCTRRYIDAADLMELLSVTDFLRLFSTDLGLQIPALDFNRIAEAVLNPIDHFQTLFKLLSALYKYLEADAPDDHIYLHAYLTSYIRVELPKCYSELLRKEFVHVSTRTYTHILKQMVDWIAETPAFLIALANKTQDIEKPVTELMDSIALINEAIAAKLRENNNLRLGDKSNSSSAASTEATSSLQQSSFNSPSGATIPDPGDVLGSVVDSLKASESDESQNTQLVALKKELQNLRDKKKALDQQRRLAAAKASQDMCEQGLRGHGEHYLGVDRYGRAYWWISVSDPDAILNADEASLPTADQKRVFGILVEHGFSLSDTSSERLRSEMKGFSYIRSASSLKRFAETLCRYGVREYALLSSLSSRFKALLPSMPESLEHLQFGSAELNYIDESFGAFHNWLQRTCQPLQADRQGSTESSSIISLSPMEVTPAVADVNRNEESVQVVVEATHLSKDETFEAVFGSICKTRLVEILTKAFNVSDVVVETITTLEVESVQDLIDQVFDLSESEQDSELKTNLNKLDLVKLDKIRSFSHFYSWCDTCATQLAIDDDAEVDDEDTSANTSSEVVAEVEPSDEFDADVIASTRFGRRAAMRANTLFKKASGESNRAKEKMNDMPSAAAGNGRKSKGLDVSTSDHSSSGGDGESGSSYDEGNYQYIQQKSGGKVTFVNHSASTRRGRKTRIRESDSETWNNGKARKTSEVDGSSGSCGKEIIYASSNTDFNESQSTDSDAIVFTKKSKLIRRANMARALRPVVRQTSGYNYGRKQSHVTFDSSESTEESVSDDEPQMPVIKKNTQTAMDLILERYRRRKELDALKNAIIDAQQ